MVKVVVMKFACVLAFLSTYYAFGDSEKGVHTPSQECTCYSPISSDENITGSIFIKNKFKFEHCAYDDSRFTVYSKCSGVFADNPLCQVSYSGTYMNLDSDDETYNFSINCNTGSCVTGINLYYDNPGRQIQSFDICQAPLGCLPLTDTKECTLLHETTLYDITLYYDYNDWEVEWIYCLGELNYAAKLSNKINKRTAAYVNDGGGYPSGSFICPYNCLHEKTNGCQPIQYINDKGCDSDFYIGKQNFVACKNGEGYGNFTNPRTNTVCTIVSTKKKHDGTISCSEGCSAYWNLGDSLSLPTFNNDPCMVAVKDGSCEIPSSFSCDDVLWDVCAHGMGSGECTHNKQGCEVGISTNCSITKAKSCGVIRCDDGCTASWNQPDKPALYDFPHGCMNTPSPFSPDNENFIIPASVAGGVVFIAVVSTIVTIAACFGYHHHKRQGYQYIQGSASN